MTFKEKLEKLNACKSAIEWVGDRDIKTAWAECKRGDWMLWLVNASNPRITLAMRKKLVLCSCDIAESVLKYIPQDEKRPAEAVRIARAWANGEKVSLNDVNAANAANAATYATNAAYAAYAAANAAYAAANAATNAAYAAYAAANAAYAAANPPTPPKPIL